MAHHAKKSPQRARRTSATPNVTHSTPMRLSTPVAPPTRDATEAAGGAPNASALNTSAADAPAAPAEQPALPPDSPPPSGKPRLPWENWSNRRLFSAGGIAIAAVVVLSLLLHGLLTPAVTATPSIHATPAPPDPLIGHYAPAATIVDFSNNPVSLTSLKGKIVVLNFWYAACEPCRYEMPALEKAYLKYKSQGVVVVGVDMVDSAQTASSYVHALGVTYPIVLDVNLHTVQTYKVFATPTTFFIDRQGVIRYKSLGPLDTATLTTDLTALLKQ